MTRRHTIIMGVLLFGIAFLLRMGVAAKMGLARPMESDSYYYLAIAKSLAHGEGYYVRDSFWPDTPTMQRMPAWPFLISLGLRAFPHASPDLVMRVTCITLDSLNAVLVAWLAWRLLGRKGKLQTTDHRLQTTDCGRQTEDGRLKIGEREREEDAAPSASLSPLDKSAVCSLLSVVFSLVAGLLYAAHPAALFLVYTGEAEPLFVTLCLTGFLLLLRGGWWACAASLCFGLSCLVRASYVVWIGVYGCLVLGAWCLARGASCLTSGKGDDASSGAGVTSPRKDRPGVRPAPVQIILIILFFLLPPLLWTVRNYTVCGHFPVLSTLRGQTFYGGNNPVVANTWEVWGYWIFPDAIPGETKASELAKTMSEYDLDVHYFHRGVTYVKEEWSSMPRLLLGKFVRAFVPIPWKPNLMSYGVGFYRTVIYVLAIVGLCWWWRQSVPSSGAGVPSPRKDRPDPPAALCVALRAGVRPAPGESEHSVPEGTGREATSAAYRQFNLWFVAMLLTGLAGVLIFWGCFRFAFVLEPVLIPFAAMGVGWVCRRGAESPIADRCYKDEDGLKGM